MLSSAAAGLSLSFDGRWAWVCFDQHVKALIVGPAVDEQMHVADFHVCLMIFWWFRHYAQEPVKKMMQVEYTCIFKL